MESISPTSVLRQEQTIGQLQHALQQSEAHRKQLAQENNRLKLQLAWEHRLFSNPHLSASQKLALWATVPEMEKGTPDERGLTHVNITYVAKKIGMSPKTTGRNLQEIAEANGLARREQSYLASDGNRQTHVLFAVTEQTSKPHLIQPSTPRNHGGLRQRCKDCGSESLVEQKIITCADCGSVQSTTTRLINPTAVDHPEENPQVGSKQEEQASQPIDNLTQVLKPIKLMDNLTIGEEKPATPPESEHPPDLQVMDELILDIAGDAPEHIVMNTNPEIVKKYLTVHRPLTLADIRQHLQGTKTVGATLAKASGSTRTLCFDADTTENWQQLQDAATLLQISGYSPLLEPSPAGRGGHLWIIFERHVQVDASLNQVCSIAPMLTGIAEYWPRGNGYKVRLPLGAYVTPTFEAKCHLYDATGCEVSLLPLTPADLIPARTVEASLQTHLSSPPDRPCTCDEQSVTLREHGGVDDYHRKKYHNAHLWFAWTPQQLAQWYQSHTTITDLLPPERNGNGLATWRGERTASVAYTKDSTGWGDFGAAARREDGKQDGGDCLELLARLLQKSKSAVMSDLGKLLVQEARAALEGAAKAGEPPPQWVEPFMTDAGWKHYDKLRQDGHRDNLVMQSHQSDQNPQADDAPQQGRGVVGFKNAAVISQLAKEQPTWDSLIQEKNNRGLPIYCSECGSFAAWYGAGVTPYCDEHWKV